MAAPIRTPEQRELDLVKIADMYCRGYTQEAMAQEIGVCRQQIGYDIKDLRQQWRESELANINEATSAELAKLDALEREAWEAWRASVGAKERVRTSSKDEERVTWEDAGDPRFLGIVQSCIDKRCAILGIGAPKKIALTDPSGQKPYRKAASEMTEGELRAVVRMKNIAAGHRSEN